MKDIGALLYHEDFGHSYPHCWRCHNPVLFRATPQWFIALDKDGYRARALEAIKKVQWIPAWGEERISNMVKERPDWCISRQRDWGVPIVAFYCKDCDETLLDKKVIHHVASIFDREGADAWYAHAPEELLPEGTKCLKCGGTHFRQEFDILDVWFDSGVSYEALARSRPEHAWPSDMYLEGGDQYRGWFHSSLLASLGSRGSSPYREVVTHGWVLDKDGLAMSKSKGNAIEPEDIIPTSGAEILRLWVGSIEYKEDVRMSEEILSRLREAYRKIRNTMRFLLANLHRDDAPAGDPFNFDPARHAVPVEAMQEIDRWALARLSENLARCDAAYNSYDFHVVYHTLYQFCAVDLSAVYFDILKDRLYTMAAGSPERRSAQTALWHILDGLVRALAPIMPFTTDEVWQHMRKFTALPESVHLADFPAAPPEWNHPELLARWGRLFTVRELVSKALEVARQAGQIGNSLEARVTLAAHPDDFAFLQSAVADLRYVFIVSAVELKEDAAAPAGQPAVTVGAAGGAKCERCWNYSPQVGAYPEFPTVCERCVDVVRSLAGA